MNCKWLFTPFSKANNESNCNNCIAYYANPVYLFYNRGFHMKNILRRKAIDSTKFVNVDTGELLADVVGGEVGSVNVQTELVEVKFLEFFVTDIHAMEYLSTIFSDVEMGRISTLCRMIGEKNDYNILYSRATKKPHTKETLMKEMDLHRNTFEPFIKKLVENSVLWILSGFINRKQVIRYVLNPTLARRKKIFPKGCTSLFEDLRKKELPSKDRISEFEKDTPYNWS
jgi:hypothetical protein